MVIPSTDPAFLAANVGIHIPLGIACVVTGDCDAFAKGPRTSFQVWHDRLPVPAGAVWLRDTLSIMRWSENYQLFVLGACSFGCGWFG